MKKIIVSIILGLLLSVTACIDSNFVTIPATPATSIPIVTANKPVVNAPDTVLPPSQPLIINTKDDLLKSSADLIYPDNIILDNYLTGIKTNQWVVLDPTPVFGHAPGDVLTVKIYNHNDFPSVFSLSYGDTYANINGDTYSSATNKFYAEAPPDAINWLTIGYPLVSLQPHELASVPISFRIPVGTVTPAQWEFRILVTNKTTSGQVSTNQQVRVLISMQGQ